jgi:peptide/nickel transport system permease protein
MSDIVAGRDATPAGVPDPTGVPATRRSARRKAFDRFVRNPRALGGLVVVVVLGLVALFADQIVPFDPAAQNISNRLAAPSAEHWLGTDDFGRDLLSRMIVGSRVSLIVGVLSVLIVLLIGVSVGLLAGYVRAWDGPLMRTVDIFMSIPDFMLILLLVSLFGTGTYRIVFYIGISSWMATARLVRGEVLKLRTTEFVLASECAGARPMRIMRRDLLLNILDVVMVQATLTISLVILLESALSYLGLGAQPPTPSWGNMLSGGRNFMSTAWWYTTFPGLAIFVTVMSFNFIGDGIRDALDVRL